MIRVLVVDDDQLVRKGLISVMPWDSFGMQVVGEAENGEKALQFMVEHPIDLLMTDLGMPVMSGIDLMRHAKERFPEVHIIVLTLHQDFDYVQEALRLGAIDYIAKIELQKERFEEVLGRIHERMVSDSKKAAGSAGSPEVPHFTADSAFLLLPSAEGDELAWVGRQDREGEWIDLDGSGWLWQPLPEVCQEAVGEALAQAAVHSRGMVIRLSGLAGAERESVLRLLRKHAGRHFFYTGDGSAGVTDDTLDAVAATDASVQEETARAHLRSWVAFDWIGNETQFRQLTDELRTMALPIPRLARLLLEIASEWNRIYGGLTHTRAEVPVALESWRQCRDWFENLRVSAAALQEMSYSKEVMQCIMTAVRIVHEELEQSVYATEVAKRVNMSRSYFNQCFKDITGSSFNEYVQQVRIEKAKEYLIRTSKPVPWIAEHTGYQDEKYFSRLFREQTGETPSEYRRSRL